MATTQTTPLFSHSENEWRGITFNTIMNQYRVHVIWRKVSGSCSNRLNLPRKQGTTGKHRAQRWQRERHELLGIEEDVA